MKIKSLIGKEIKKEYMKRSMILILVTIFSLVFNYASSQVKKISFSLEISPLLLYNYKSYEKVEHENMFNYLFGSAASAFIIDKRIDLSINTGLFIKSKNYKSKYWDVYALNQYANSINKYTFLSIPLTIKCQLDVNHHFFAYAEAGIFLNWMIYKYYYFQYPDGTSLNEFPSELEFTKLHELFFAINIGRNIKENNYSFGLKPYVLYKFMDEGTFTDSFYNLGRFGFGLSFIFTYYLTIKSK
jgi:hypothetical protein